MGSFDFITLFFLVAAVIIFLQLRSVLGKRTGNERPPVDPYSPSVKPPMARKHPARWCNCHAVMAPARKFRATPRSTPLPSAGTPLNDALRRMTDADPAFDPKEFVNGAKMAYEMIVMAFADGDRKTLKGLLSRDVYDGFDAAISERESKGEVVKSTFVGIEKADMVHAEIKDSEANITLRIISQLISATYDKAGAIVDGDAEAVSEVNDLWTFSRDTRSRDPNWKLIATESEN